MAPEDSAAGMSPVSKIAWRGLVLAVQPRIRLIRSFDQRHHGYLGYALRLRGEVGGQDREFTVGIGQAAQAKHGFRVGHEISGLAVPVGNPELESADLYKVSGLTVLASPQAEHTGGPPWCSVPPSLEIYRGRGHRRLDPRTYDTSCLSCIWGCRMPVEMIVDQWKPDIRHYRLETFCYGPKSCPSYRAGATRKVPGRNNMMWEEEDWVDEEATSHRGPDE